MKLTFKFEEGNMGSPSLYQFPCICEKGRTRISSSSDLIIPNVDLQRAVNFGNLFVFCQITSLKFWKQEVKEYTNIWQVKLLIWPRIESGTITD